MFVGGHAFLTQFSNPVFYRAVDRKGKTWGKGGNERIGYNKLNKVPNSAEVRVCDSDTDGHRFEPHMDTFFFLCLFFLPTYKAG